MSFVKERKRKERMRNLRGWRRGRKKRWLLEQGDDESEEKNEIIPRKSTKDPLCSLLPSPNRSFTPTIEKNTHPPLQIATFCSPPPHTHTQTTQFWVHTQKTPDFPPRPRF
mmetsp:Transcript_55803/g.65213  ORF Transcript_55803/g.65213 Transcript_55803/m.65213 type:complete len:111 (+) Transcript_55803:51-383(+)